MAFQWYTSAYDLIEWWFDVIFLIDVNNVQCNSHLEANEERARNKREKEEGKEVDEDVVVVGAADEEEDAVREVLNPGWTMVLYPGTRLNSKSPWKTLSDDTVLTICMIQMWLVSQ